MSQVEAVFFNCDDTLVDSEVICSRAYVAMFRELGIHADLKETFTCFRDVKLYEVINIISKEQGTTIIQADVEHTYHAEVVRLLDTGLEDIAGANELLTSINVPMYVVSNGLVNKIRHSLGKLNMLHYFPEELFSGYDIQRWRPDPASIFYTTEVMNVNVENCILVGDSSTDTQSGINAGMEVFYFYADPHSKPIVHPEVTTPTHLS